MILPAKVYNVIKYLVMIVLPSLTTLWLALANAWNLDHMTNIAVTMTAITAFLGSLVGVSSRNYNNSEDKYFGELEVSQTDEGAVINRQVFNEDPRGCTLADKKEVMFKVVRT